jgi:hypothetical protein
MLEDIASSPAFIYHSQIWMLLKVPFTEDGILWVVNRVNIGQGVLENPVFGNAPNAGEMLRWLDINLYFALILLGYM